MNEVDSKSHELLEMALALDASDIHFVPRRHDTLIELRINNHLYELEIMPNSFAQKLISHFKYVSGMDIGDKRKPQDGAMDLTVTGENVNLRLSTLPATFNESLVIRILPQTPHPRLSDLSIFPECTQQLESFLNYDSGLILFSGPTGSGKTTSLYTLLASAARRYNSRIVTLEEPVEKKHDAFVQMEVNEKAALTYSRGFKAILRHDPDIIMVGEIRDVETARLAIRAAFTGHLVLSTVHANDTAGTIFRLIELGITRLELKDVLLGVVAQRLFRIQCPVCGPVCNSDCRHHKVKKRTAVFEILSGMALHDILIKEKHQKRKDYKKLEDYIRIGIAMGYIPNNTGIDRKDNPHVLS